MMIRRRDTREAPTARAWSFRVYLLERVGVKDKFAEYTAGAYRSTKVLCQVMLIPTKKKLL
jgi:hypothetical protein